MKLVDMHLNSFKHGLTKAQIQSAFNSGHSSAIVRSKDYGQEPLRWALIGWDNEGRPIELLFVETQKTILIIHANYLTKGFLKEMRK